MKRILLSLIVVLFYYSSIYGQLLPEEPIRCYTVEYHELRKQSNLRIPSTQDFENTMAAQIAAAQQDNINNGIIKGVLRIPVIVHVVHFGEPVGTGANIAAAQVYSQIDVMNEDFRRQTGSLGYNSDPRGADTEIEFVPAEYDPEGNKLAEPGIRRYRGPLPAYVLEDIDLLIKPATIYDPTRYLNMWTVNFAALLLGYAQFPDPAHGLASGLGCDAGGASTDGVVMGYNAFGSRAKYPAGTYHKNYDLGRTVTHEVGHYLGLRHLWGDGDLERLDESCYVDDYCGDTPNSGESSGGCPAGKVSCSNLVMYENYMDYSYDKCMNIFTRDQTLRMRTVLTKSTRRRELLSSTVHLAPVGLDAAVIDIVSPKGQRTSGNLVPEVLLRNLGQTTLTSVVINYQVNSGSVRTYQWTGSLKTSEIALVTLPALSAKDGDNTFTVFSSKPNGGTDERTFNDKWSDAFIVSNLGQKLPFSENFNSGLYPPSNKWHIENPDRCVSWSPVSNIVGADGQLTSTTFLDYYQYDATGTKDGLVLPLVNLNNAENSTLEFDVAYSQSDSYVDQLQVFVSVDGGLTFNKVYDKSGAELATAPPAGDAFYPTSASHWRRESISLNNYRSGQVLIKFVGTNGYGDNIFVDNITINGNSKQKNAAITSAQSPTTEEVKASSTVAPNPTTGTFEVTYESSREGRVTARLLNSTGAVSYTKAGTAFKGLNRMQINASGLARGVYFLLLETPDATIRERVIIK